MRLLKRKSRTFEIQVQEMTLHIQAATDVDEESRAAALSFWEQSCTPTRSVIPTSAPRSGPSRCRQTPPRSSARSSRRPRRAGVGPMFSFQGAVTDHVGRFLAREVNEVTVNCGGDYFIRSRTRQKLTVRPPAGLLGGRRRARQPGGLGISMTSGSGRGAARSTGWPCWPSRACSPAPRPRASRRSCRRRTGSQGALAYLKQVPGVIGGVVFLGERIGMAGGLELAA